LVAVAKISTKNQNQGSNPTLAPRREKPPKKGLFFASKLGLDKKRKVWYNFGAREGLLGGSKNSPNP